MPAVEGQDGARVVAVVAQQPPETLGAAHRPVGDDVRLVVDSGARHRLDEALRRRQWMPAARTRWIGQLLLDVDEHRAGDVAFEIRASAEVGIADVPASVDEAVAHV